MRLTVRCSLSTTDPADCLKLLEYSMKSTSPTISRSHHLSSRISYSILVRLLVLLYSCLLIPLDAYDVNVSPDKRTILLHEQNALLDSLRVRQSFPILQASSLTAIGFLS
jgi:hypothetical protein